MRQFLTTKNIIQYIYILLLISLLFLADFYLFSLLLQYYDSQLLLILMGIVAGTSALFILNSIIARIKTITKEIYVAKSMYYLFSEIIILCIASTFLILPGIITSAIGLCIYIKPIRLICAHGFYKKDPQFIIKLFSVFLAEHIPKE